ncbi:MAG: hypothetical protein WD894_24915 [Pirellulales bacterium]
MNRSNEDRHRLLQGLDSVDRVLVAVYRVFLGLIVAAILAVVVLVIVWQPWGAGDQGEWFYFGIAVLLALGWVVGQFAMLNRRQRHRHSGVTLDPSAGARDLTWTFRFGSNDPNAHHNPRQ